MLRSPQQLVLQLSIAPTRRSLTTAVSSYSSHPDKPPPPPAPVTTISAPPPGSATAALRAIKMSADTAAAATTAKHDLQTNPVAGSRPPEHEHSTAASSPSPSVRPPSPTVRPSSSSPSLAPSQPTGRLPAQSRLTSFFPLGYREAVQQWWSNVSASAAERGVLAYVPFLREAKTGGSQPDLSQPADQPADPYGPRLWRSQMVPLSGKHRALNEYSVEQVDAAASETPNAPDTAPDTLVMLHGYGAGLGFYYRNFEPLSRPKGWRLYALDMLGMGNSTRPSFKVQAKERQAKITEAENWFIDALEEWRQIRKIERFTLLGHSLGGYLAVSYALKYPGRLNKLILASPVGIPEDPYAVSAALPDPEDSTLASEFTQDQDALAYNDDSSDDSVSPSSRLNNNNKKPERRPLPSWLVWLWDANVSPFSLVRASGPLGPRLVSGWTSRRFSHLPPEEAEALHTYSYSLFRQRGSGEYALPYLLAPGAYARRPVINRIHEVGRQVVAPATATTPAVRETGFPIVFMYGDHDWMDVAGGYAAEEKLKARIMQSLLHGSEEEKRHENGSAKVMVIRNAGHHLYLDNPRDFNEAVQREMEDTAASERRRRRQLAQE